MLKPLRDQVEAEYKALFARAKTPGIHPERAEIMREVAVELRDMLERTDK